MTNCVILFSNFDKNKAWERADFLALLLCCFVVFLSQSHTVSISDVVLGCIDS